MRIRPVLLALALIFPFSAARAGAASVTSYSGGSALQVSLEDRLGDLSGLLGFEILSTWVGPVPVACTVSWPADTIRRRFRARAQLDFNCSSGEVLATPRVTFKSPRGSKHSAAVQAFVDLSNCAAPILVQGAFELVGGPLDRFVRRGVEPVGGLTLELRCTARQGVLILSR